MQLAGVEHKDARRYAGLVDQMGDDHVFSAQAGGLGERPGGCVAALLQQRQMLSTSLASKSGRRAW